MAKLNEMARLIMIVITTASIMFGVVGGIYGRSNTSMKAKMSKIEERQNKDHTEIQLLKQKIDRIDRNVSDIHKVIYKPNL